MDMEEQVTLGETLETFTPHGIQTFHFVKLLVNI